MTDAELDEFIDDAARRSVDDAWWIQDFCEEAEGVGRELKKLREEKRAAVGATATTTSPHTA